MSLTKNSEKIKIVKRKKHKTLKNQYISNKISPSLQNFWSSRPEVLLEKGVLKICRKFTGQNLCRSVIVIKVQSNFIEITFWHGCSPVNLLHIFRTTFSNNTSGWLLLKSSIYKRNEIINHSRVSLLKNLLRKLNIFNVILVNDIKSNYKAYEKLTFKQW